MSAHPVIAPALIDWHRRNGRYDLPWQQDPTPYRVWVSEIMLQQTQVATVIAYYQRFMQRFATLASLAAAPIDEVLHLWSGLGYYSRARNLQRAAQRVMAEHGGALPADQAALAALPGIGRSTAAAILALGMNRRAAILDGNVRRVLSRYAGVAGDPADRATLNQLWQLAEAHTPHQQVAVYTQAIMDFGATLCTRSKPLCLHCPLNAQCVARLTGRVAELPTPRRRAARRTRSVVMVLAVRSSGEVLLQQRPPQGIWGGLWSPPEFDSRETAAAYCAAQLCGEIDATLPVLEHAFTHFDLQITPLRARCRDPHAVMQGPGLLWYNARDPARIGVPAPIATLLASPDLSV